MLDFSNEENQKEFASGPVPAGSIVVVEMSVLQPKEEYQAPEGFLIARTRNGMRQIYCQFVVSKGEYARVQWRESINLPFSMQHENLTEGQRKACQIGGATLKAILEAAGKPLKMQHIGEFSGLRFPVQVKISDKPSEKDGRVYWNNAIRKIITPSMPEYNIVKQQGEIINEKGALTGNPANAASYSQSSPFDATPAPSEVHASIDDYVF